MSHDRSPRIRRRIANRLTRLSCQLASLSAPHMLFYVISHERAGTHFTINSILRNCVIRRGMHNIGEWFGPYENPADQRLHIDAFNAKWAQKQTGPSIIKSHCDRDLFEAYYKKAKIIYVLRDPRDVMTSWFHYLNNPKYYAANPQVPDHHCASFADFIRRPASPFLLHCYSLKGDFSNVAERWAKHAKGWIDAPDTIVVRYEDLKIEPSNVLGEVADFLGLSLRRKISRVTIENAPSILPRKGTIGDWRSLFSPEDERFLMEAIEHRPRTPTESRSSPTPIDPTRSGLGSRTGSTTSSIPDWPPLPVIPRTSYAPSKSETHPSFGPRPSHRFT